jgi:hypothetical protein
VSCRASPRYIELADQEMFAFAREVKTTNQLQLVAYGGGFYERVNHFSLTFMSPQYPSVEDARILFFDVANRFLERVNQNEELRPYMANYPFTIIDNLALMIVFPESRHAVNAVLMGDIYEHRKREFVVFTGYKSGKQDLGLIHDELYEEAVQLYEQQKRTCHESCRVD